MAEFVMNTRDEEVKWYVMRSYCVQAPKVRDLLAVDGIEYFQARQYILKTIQGRRQKVLQYFMEDFFFVHETYDRISRVVKQGVPLRFYLNVCSHKQHDCVVVPDAEMENFIRVASAYDRSPEIVPFDSIVPCEGRRVRICSGDLEGVVGTYAQVKRGRRRQLVLSLQNYMTVIAGIRPDDLVEEIK